jgi:hypothetical protein
MAYSNSTPQIYEDKKKSGSVWSWIGKQLMKPVGVASQLFGAGTDIVGGAILPKVSKGKISYPQSVKAVGESLVQRGKNIADVVTGKKTTSFQEQYIQNKESVREGLKKYYGVDLGEKKVAEKFADGAIGLSADLVLDPLNKFSKIKPAISAVKTGVSNVSEKVLSNTGRFGESIKNVSEKLKESVASVFNPETSIPEFNAVVDKFRNLRKYQEGLLVNKASQMGKDITNYAKQTGKTVDELNSAITNLLENPAARELVTDKTILSIVDDLKYTYSDFLSQSKNVGLSIGEIVDYAPHIRTKESFINEMVNPRKGSPLGSTEFGIGQVEKGRKLGGTINQLTEQGIDIFEKNPAIQLVKKGQMYVKAITSKQFAEEVGKFASNDGVEVANKLLEGKKFTPEIARVVDNYYSSIKPEALNAFIKTYDKVQNWWKASALTSPAYHVRNFAGNIWNNFVAGINPIFYKKAIQAQIGSLPEEVELAKKLGVINEGWYASDIGDEIINRVKGIGNWKKGINPLSRSNYLFKLNKNIGSAVENNSRLAHWFSKMADGLSPEEAARSVKKYLFNYDELTQMEKTVFKRVFPFYTWTRKNLPVQLEGLLNQPAKYVLPYKLQAQIEDGVEKPDEKYMSDYIKSNIPIRVAKDKNGNTRYLLLGQWLPYASAINLLSQPMDMLVQQLSPLLKLPIENTTNTSLFFKNTLGERSKIDMNKLTEFAGIPMKTRYANLLNNIRLFSEINRFIGKQDKTATQDTVGTKIFRLFFGKTATYDVNQSRYFYNKDTDEKVQWYEAQIKDAKRKGYKNEIEKLVKEMKNFIKERKQK